MDRTDLAAVFRAAIAREINGGRTPYAVAVAAGLKPELLYRFIRGDRDLRLSSASKLAAALGLVLTSGPGWGREDSKSEPKARPATRKAKKRSAAGWSKKM